MAAGLGEMSNRRSQVRKFVLVALTAAAMALIAAGVVSYWKPVGIGLGQPPAGGISTDFYAYAEVYDCGWLRFGYDTPVSAHSPPCLELDKYLDPVETINEFVPIGHSPWAANPKHNIHWAPFRLVHHQIFNDPVGHHYRYGFVLLPVWVAALALALLPAVAVIRGWLRRRRRRRKGLCVNCGYDLTGNLSGVCSECGQALAVPSPPTV